MAANPERGEAAVSVERNGVTTEYVLKPTVNSMVAVQKRRGKTIAEIEEGAKRCDVEDIREYFWMLLQRHHGAEFATLDKVGDLMDEIGFYRLGVAFGQVQEANAPEGETNPPVAPESTGAAPSLTRVA